MCWPSEPSATGGEKPGSAQGGGSAGLRSWKFQAARTVLLLYWHLWEKFKFQAEPPQGINTRELHPKGNLAVGPTHELVGADLLFPPSVTKDATVSFLLQGQCSAPDFPVDTQRLQDRLREMPGVLLNDWGLMG